MYIPVAVFVIPRFPPKTKLIIILVILDGLSGLWWLIASALLVAAAVKISGYVDVNRTGSYYDDFKPALDMTWICAALGAFELSVFSNMSSGLVLLMRGYFTVLYLLWLWPCSLVWHSLTLIAVTAQKSQYQMAPPSTYRSAQKKLNRSPLIPQEALNCLRLALFRTWATKEI